MAAMPFVFFRHVSLISRRLICVFLRSFLVCFYSIGSSCIFISHSNCTRVFITFYSFLGGQTYTPFRCYILFQNMPFDTFTFSIVMIRYLYISYCSCWYSNSNLLRLCICPCDEKWTLTSLFLHQFNFHFIKILCTQPFFFLKETVLGSDGL